MKMKIKHLIIIGLGAFVLVFGVFVIVYQMTGMYLQTAYHYYFIKNGCTQISVEKFLPEDLNRLDSNTIFLHFTENDLSRLYVIKNIMDQIEDDGNSTYGMFVTEAEWVDHWNYFKNSYDTQFGEKSDESFETNFEYNNIRYVASFPMC